SRQAKGQAIVNLLQLQEDERVTSMLKTGEKFSGQSLVMATTKGTIKKTPVEDFKNVRKSGLIAIKLRAGDSLEWVKECSKDNEVVMVTKEGKCIRFNEKDARDMGRASIGVRGMKLRSGDEVVQMDTVQDPEESELLVIMENGLGKMTKIQDYRLQSRGGTGVKTANITSKTGKIVGATVIAKDTDADLIMMSKSGVVIRLHAQQIPSQGRATQGVYLMRMKPNDKVASTSLIAHASEEEIEKSQEEAEKAQKISKKAQPELLDETEEVNTEEEKPKKSKKATTAK
ncbi:DNA gyrase subunit A, partial [Candidatus Peregrinibacteria bacterium]|nr:DNA gyrase subunit A [Candidatus Peregrinibacteria bacterium]